MGRIFLLLCAFLLCVNHSSAQVESNLGSARSSSLANQGITFGGADALFLNQAGLAQTRNFSLVAYGDNRFGIAGLGAGAFGLVVPVNTGSFGLVYSRFGFETYREQKVGIAYGLALSEYLDLGLQLDWLQTGVSDLNDNSFTAEIGLIAHLSEQVDLAFHVFNPVDFFEDQSLQVRVPTILRLGLSYSVTDELILLAETAKTTNTDPNLKLGIEYGFAERFYARLGYAFEPQNIAFGLGFNLGEFRVDLAGTSHQILGFSPQLSVLWSKSNTR